MESEGYLTDRANKTETMTTIEESGVVAEDVGKEVLKAGKEESSTAQAPTVVPTKRIENKTVPTSLHASVAGYHKPAIRSQTFIIQKYIERPLLINKRKFDIRVWVALTHDMDVYFFKEGYLRTSSTPFNLSSAGLDDDFVHLTNNAI